MEKINKIIVNPLSDVLIKKYFDGHANIVTMEDISHMVSINQLFRGYNHAVIFVAVNSPTDGHWQLIYKSFETLHFFDSYGMKPTELITKLNKNNTYGQNKNLDNLIIKSQYAKKSYYNDVKYQSDGKSQTCGRYVAINFLLLHIYNKKNIPYDGTVFYRIMQHFQTQFKTKSYDKIVSSFINEIDFNTF